jgi:2-polyprenyl-6-methoxyphenol hydroxylase-like FAD-dependent oxidoreductase
MTAQRANALVVGAGPAGLSAALELSRLGVTVRIVDKTTAATKESRAILVNLHSLDLLEPTGASDRLIASGVKLRGARIVVDGRTRAEFDASRLRHKHRFLLAVAQSETERVLAEALAARGVEVEREVEAVDVVNGADSATARLRTRRGETLFAANWIIGADGAHSAVRHRLGLEFPGAPYPFHWSLADLDLAGDAEPDRAELRLERHGPVLVRAPLAPGRHRLISNAPDVVSRAPASWKPGRVHWRSDFSVSHRMVKSRGLGRIWLVGDAAHIHSPAGGRGMNLGIEDAVLLARAIAGNGDLAAWETSQQRHAAAVVRESDAMQRIATSQGMFGRVLMPAVVGFLSRIPPVHDRMIARVAGIG